MTRNNLQKDIKVIRNIYKSKGFQNVSVIAKIEKFSQDRINLIYEIDEKNQQKINIIKFTGNNFFSDNYLNSIINSQSLKFYNIFKSGSNLNYGTFEFDKNKIISTYKDNGFFNVKVSYNLQKSSFSNNILYFYINEGDRTKIDNIKFVLNDENLSNLNNSAEEFKEQFKKNEYFYDKILIDQYVELFNEILVSNNIHNKYIDFDIIDNEAGIDLSIFEKNKEPVIISKIDIKGNSITKNKTIRSKISIEPGQYLNKYIFDKSIKNLKRYPYINDVKSETIINDQIAEISLNIDEEKNR